MEIKEIKTEADLAAATISFFPEWDIYCEVPFQGGSIDIFGVNGVIRMAIEAKLKFNFDVLEQAYRNRAVSTLSYVVVPQPKKNPSFTIKVYKNYGIGILFVDKNGTVREALKPKFNRNFKKIKLESWMKNSVAGSLHGRETAYSYAMSEITQAIKRNKGRMSFANIFSKTTYHWSSLTSAKACILMYIRKGIIKNIKHDKGYLVLVRDVNIDK
jgi:hypothetical protein